jgi:RHS repeat-associated protein
VNQPSKSPKFPPPNFWVGIRNISDYSPFGVLLKERTVESANFRRGFQGQEYDDEVKGEGNYINFKYRGYDPRIGRFSQVDPLSPDFPHNSPYAFCENRVVNARELEGLETFDVYIQEVKTDPKLHHVWVGKIDNDATNGVIVNYHHLDKDGNITSSELNHEGFKAGSVEDYAMNQEYKSTGKTRIEAMDVTEEGVGANGKRLYQYPDEIKERPSGLRGLDLFQYDLTIYFKSDKSKITREQLEVGTYTQAINDINKFKSTIQLPINLTSAGGAKIDLANLNTLRMVVNGETDSNPSNYKNGCGNPCLGEDRANNLLNKVQSAHPNNNIINVINHEGDYKPEDRNSSIFFVPNQ